MRTHLTSRIDTRDTSGFFGWTGRVRPFRLLATLAATAALAACDTSPADLGGEPTPAEVTVEAPSDSLMLGDTTELSVTVTDSDDQPLTGLDVAWSSSDASVLTVDSAGMAVAVGIGSATVTATVEGVAGETELTVTEVPLAGVALSVADTSFPIGETRQLVAVVEDVRGDVVGDAEIMWESDDLTRVTVSSGGLLTAVSPGPATITATVAGVSASIEVGAYRPGFVTRLGRRFMLDGEPFDLGAANSQVALAGLDKRIVDGAMANAVQMGVRALRLWGSSEMGSHDGSVPTLGQWPDARPVYQYWDPEAGRPAYNDGPGGLEMLDYAVAKAGEAGLRLTISLVDNWDWYWGGMDQYVEWYGETTHGAFFTDERIRQAYRDWVAHLLDRVNTVTGVRYADDPTIMSWGLANEASCWSGDRYPQGSCHRTDIEAWIRDMSAYVRSLDPNHLISVGDVGFFGGWEDDSRGWPYHTSNEPDFETVLAMPDIDYGTYHLYLDHLESGSLTPLEWGERFVRDHERITRELNKPAVFEEFGSEDQSNHEQIFDTWIRALDEEGGAGFMFYQVAVRVDGEPVWGEEGDGFNTYPDSPTASTVQYWVDRLNSRE